MAGMALYELGARGGSDMFDSASSGAGSAIDILDTAGKAGALALPWVSIGMTIASKIAESGSWIYKREMKHRNQIFQLQCGMLVGQNARNQFQSSTSNFEAFFGYTIGVVFIYQTCVNLTKVE